MLPSGLGLLLSEVAEKQAPPEALLRLAVVVAAPCLAQVLAQVRRKFIISVVPVVKGFPPAVMY